MKSKTGLIIAAVIGGSFLVCGGLGAVGLVFADKAKTDVASVSTPLSAGPESVAAKPAEAAPAKVATIGLNQPARDGKFEFKVTKIECGVAQIGDQYLNVKAQGQFCKVSVSVANIGDKPRMFDASSQHAFNAAGQQYDADSTAGIYLEDAGNAFLKDINPGNSVAGIVVFDIAKGASIKRLELHDSAFSGGVTVTL